MTGAELLDVLRSELDDVVKPTLWTDEELYRYLDDAQIAFCEQVGGIRDSRSPLTQVAAAQGDLFVAYDPRILKLKRVSVVGEDIPLNIYNFEHIDNGVVDTGYGASGTPVLDTTEGEVRAVVTNMEENMLRLVRPPNSAITLALVVDRLPLENVSEDTAGEELEIPVRHHRFLTMWAKHLAFLKQDAETFDRGQSDYFADRFLRYTDGARAAISRREHTPRIVTYGGY